MSYNLFFPNIDVFLGIMPLSHIHAFCRQTSRCLDLSHVFTVARLSNRQNKIAIPNRSEQSKAGLTQVK